MGAKETQEKNYEGRVWYKGHEEQRDEGINEGEGEQQIRLWIVDEMLSSLRSNLVDSGFSIVDI